LVFERDHKLNSKPKFTAWAFSFSFSRCFAAKKGAKKMVWLCHSFKKSCSFSSVFPFLSLAAQKVFHNSQNRCYLFTCLLFRLFSLSFPFTPNPPKLQRVLRAEQNPKTKPKKSPKKEAKQSR
jgi:hypothetical protein